MDTHPPSQTPAVSVRISADPIDGEALVRRVAGPAEGAVILFLGTVRDHNLERAVIRLDYEAYEPMALRELETVCAEAGKRFGLSRVAAVHRIGSLEPGQTSLGVAVSSPHRDAAYRASRWIVEEVKRRLPVWKREAYADGTDRWLAGRPASATRGAAP